jgi:hypothetical protein
MVLIQYFLPLHQQVAAVAVVLVQITAEQVVLEVAVQRLTQHPLAVLVQPIKVLQVVQDLQTQQPHHAAVVVVVQEL